MTDAPSGTTPNLAFKLGAYLRVFLHDLYFEPKYEDFRPRTIWSLSNAFTSAFKALEPIPQFKATANAGRVPGNALLTVVLALGLPTGAEGIGA
jgi:hypothetical protein